MADEQREFWSRVAGAYDRVVDLQLGARTRAMVRERVAREGRLGRLVEIGCGSGFYTRALAERAESVVATDLSPGMLALAEERVDAANVTFRTEDCQETSFPDGSFDTAFMSLVLHFTEPDATLVEMARILKRGGTLIVSNLDPGALGPLDRVRCAMRILYQGVRGYRTKPPARFGRNLLTEQELRDRLDRFGFRILSSETIRDPSRSSNVPVEYVRAVRV